VSYFSLHPIAVRLCPRGEFVVRFEPDELLPRVSLSYETGMAFAAFHLPNAARPGTLRRRRYAMKKLILASVSALALFGVAACSDSTDSTTTQSTTPPATEQPAPATPEATPPAGGTTTEPAAPAQ
jgi:hypothetical protein